MKLKAVAATSDHVASLIDWFKDQAEMTQWGGPNISFTHSGSELAQQLHIDEIPSLSFFDEDDVLVGFGQYYVRLERGHLGRIGIVPHRRGQGLSHQILELLKQHAFDAGFSELSLFVDGDNVPALKCYQKGGFVNEIYPEQLPIGMTNIQFMVYRSPR